MQCVISLKKSCLLYVGEHAQFYNISCFRELPVTLLDQLQHYLSAYELHKLHALYTELGVSTKTTWWTLLKKRWPERHHRVAHVFHGDDVISDPHQRYFEKHFRELLQQLQFNSYLDTHWKLNLSLHKIQKSKQVSGINQVYNSFLMGSCPQQGMLTASLLQYLHYYSRWVRRLSILGTQCHHLLQQTQLLDALKDAVEAIDLHLVHDRMYPYIRRLIGYLLKEGRLKSLMLYNARLNDVNMRELLSLCSGKCEYQDNTPPSPSGKDSSFVEPSTLKSLLALNQSRDKDDSAVNHPSCSDGSGGHCSTAGASSSSVQDSITGKSPLDLNDLEDYYSSSGENETANSDEEDLYDAALTSGTSSSHQSSHNNPPTSRPIPILVSKRHYENCATGSPNKKLKTDYAYQEPDSRTIESQPTVSIVGDHSRFIEDFCGNNLASSYEAVHHGGQVVPSDPSKPNKGLESFAIMFTGLCELDEIIREALPDWSSLRKMAISHTMLLNEGLQRSLMSMLLSGQLTELVIEDTKMPTNLMDFIAMVLTGKKDDVPAVRALTLTNNGHPLSAVNVQVPSNKWEIIQNQHFPTKPFNGVVRLNLSSNKFKDAGIDLLCCLLSKDNSLQTLELEGCGLSASASSRILTALKESKSIQSLSLADNFAVGEVMTDIIEFMQIQSNFKVLCLNNCFLQKAEVGGENFLQTVVNHPTLEELSLSGNHLGDAGCKLLLKLSEGWTSSQKPRLTHLNIGYNQIAGDALVQCGVKVASDLEGSGLLRPLKRLVLTGNMALQQHWARLSVFCKVAHELEANMMEETSVPLAEHVALM